MSGFTQLGFLQQILPNSKNILEEENLKDKISTAIFYCFDISTTKLDGLINHGQYQTPMVNPNVTVKFKDIGSINLARNKCVEKVNISFNFARDLENAYDYETMQEKISKIVIKNEITAYSYYDKLFINAGQKEAKTIVHCIRDNILRDNKIEKTAERNKAKSNIFKTTEIDLEKFMKYLVEKQTGIVKAIYAGNLPQKENESVIIYGDEADKSDFYKKLKKLSNIITCITVQLNLNSSSSPKSILFMKNQGVLIHGHYSEERALNLLLEINDLIEDFILHG